MATSDVQQLLDGLDRQLALGQIDFGTYQSLRTKFSAQALTPASDSIGTAVGQLGKEAHVIKCPGCLAPLNPVAGAEFLTCEFCGGSYSVKAAADEMEKLRGDIRRWISDLAGTAGTGGAMDEAARKFIFRDKLLPSLRLDAERATETFSMFRHGALFSFPLATDLPNSPFLAALNSMPDSNTLASRIRVTEARAESPEMRAFAVADVDKSALQLIQAQCQESTRLSATRQHAFAFDVAGMETSEANLSALQAIYEQFSKLNERDPAQVKFAKAMGRRCTALREATHQLRGLLRESDGIMTDPITSAIERAATECEAAASDIDASGADPRDSVPAAEGARVDAKTVRILCDCVRLFGSSGAEAGHRFRDFTASLSMLVQRAKESRSDLDWLAGFISRLAMHTAALAGEPTVASVLDFANVDTAARADVRSALFAGTETMSVKSRLLVPFWIAELHYSQQTGVIFKKGHAAQQLLFVDAATHGGRWIHSSVDSTMGQTAVTALDRLGALSRGFEAFVPVVSAERALALLKQIVNSTQGYAGGRPKLLGLVYLPAVRASFVNKKGERSATFVCDQGPQFSDLNGTTTRLGTVELKLA